jgi:hypothetical protein
MPTELTSNAVEQSTFAISAAFTDDEGVAVIPTSITWTLCNDWGAIIDSLENKAVETPASSITIILRGDNLKILDQENDFETRFLEISALYNSDLGDDLPLNDRAEFKVVNLRSIS